MNIDYGLLWTWIDKPVTVTLHVRSGENDYTDFTVINCFKRATDDAGTELSNTTLQGNTTFVHMWRTNLEAAMAGLQPNEDDNLTVLGIRYTIDEVKIHNHGERFRCRCRQLIARTDDQ